MKTYQIIEKYFWLFLIAGLILGLWYPFFAQTLMSLIKPILMLMLFFVFMKTDVIQAFKTLKDLKLVAYIIFIHMLAVPVMLFYIIKFIDPKFAIAVLLLTSMPAAIASPTLTDIVKGNISVSLIMVIITSLIAPFTVPLLFSIAKINDLNIQPFHLFTDLIMIVFIPTIASQIVRKYFSSFISKKQHWFTPINIIFLVILVYAAIGSQRSAILEDVSKIFKYVVYLYLIFILLHVAGYLTAFKHDKATRTALAIGSAYMNNGIAIVLAAIHFDPFILILMILSEVPWNTMLGPFRYVLRFL